MSSKHNPASKKNAKTTAKAPTDPIGSLIARAQKMKPASLDAFLEGQDTADLRQMHTRLVGEQAGPRTSQATLVVRIKSALTTAAKAPKPVVAKAAAASVAEEAAVVAEERPAEEPAAVVEEPVAPTQPEEEPAPVVDPAPTATDAPTAESASNDPVDAVLVQAVALARKQGNESYVHQMEEAMAEARRAVASGADPKTCSDAIAAYHDGETDRAGFLAALEAAVAAIANVAPVDAPVEEPAPVAATTTDDATTGHTDAPAAVDGAPAVGTCDRCGRTDVTLRADGALTLHDRLDGRACNLATESAPKRDGIDILITRAQVTTPDALGLFLEAQPAKDLRAMLERLTGQKTSGRLSPASAIERITAALAKPAEKPASESTAGESTTPAPAGEATAPRERPARNLPPVGTVIVKSDRNGAERVRCVIVESGVEYGGKVYKSLSAAAIAAAHDLGLTTKQLNGWAWWNLAKPAARPAKAKGLDLDAIARVWTKYRERIEGALKDASAEDKSKLHLVLNAHSTAVLHLAAAAAEGEAKAETA